MRIGDKIRIVRKRVGDNNLPKDVIGMTGTISAISSHGVIYADFIFPRNIDTNTWYKTILNDSLFSANWCLTKDRYELVNNDRSPEQERQIQELKNKIRSPVEEYILDGLENDIL
jgi:hypothetical protein